MSTFQNTIERLGDEVVARKIVERTIEEFSDNLITSVGERAFHKCTLLTEVNLPSITRIEMHGFSECSSLESITADNVKTTAGYVFKDCVSLKHPYFPNLTSIGSYFVQNCTSLMSVNLPAIINIGTNVFDGCSSLAEADFSKAEKIGSSAFRNCKVLKKLILRNESLCVLSTTNSFFGTPFVANGSGGTVYVPQALIESYQNATNWSTLYAAGKCIFAPIEGSEYE